MSARVELLAALVACAGCAVGPDFKRPPLPGDARFTVEGPPPRAVWTNGMAADWWRLLRCAKLDALVADAQAKNPSIESAQATLRKSQDALRAGYGLFVPQADAALGASRQQATPQRLGMSGPPTVFNLFTLSATVSYALDIWGGQRRTLEGLRAQVEAQRYQLLGAYLVLAGNVANAVIAQAAYDEEARATRDLVAAEEEQVRIAEAQAQAGTTGYASVLGLRSQIALTRATLPPLEQKRDQARHLLAALLGRTPGAYAPPSIALADLALPDEIPLSLPSQLVRQRPDILVAEAQLHAANAQIGVATAALLPNVTLSGGVGAANTSLGDLFSSGSLFWSIAGSLTQPLLRGGTLWYQRAEAIDARDAALGGYKQTVLAAFTQVADALRALAHDADAVAAEEEAARSSEAALRLVRIDYQSGIAGYLQVLAADAQYQQARIGLVEARARRLQDTVALFVALGGGWWNAR